MASPKDYSESENEIAEAVSKAMLQKDAVVTALGIKLEVVKPGFAKMSMPIRADMLNSHGTCHGGMTFTLADTAFAYSCNSRNESTVALACTITFAQAVYEGETLTATAEEEVLNGRTGLYNIVVTNNRGDKVAFFRGNSYKTANSVVAELPKPAKRT